MKLPSNKQLTPCFTALA